MKKKVTKKTPTVTALENIIRWQDEHAQNDKRHFDDIAQLLKGQPTKEDFVKFQATIEEGTKLLATKQDMAELLTVWNNIKIGAGFVSGGGKWAYRFILLLAALFGAWAVVTGGLKAMAIAISHWALSR